jgi:hypothetical protein
MPIPRTPVEIVAEGPKILSRLGRALAAVEQGDAGAGDDLANVLRMLLDTTNRGNRVMARLAGALNVKLPSVFVSGGPTTDWSHGLMLSFGNLPLTPAPGDGQPHSPRWLPFDAWMDTYSIVVPDSEKRRLSWRQYITLVANTNGSHLGTEYHDLFETSNLFDAVGMSLQDYLLRQIGWQIERTLTEVLARSGRPLIPRTRRIDFLPRTPIWMEFRDSQAGMMEVAVSVSATSDEAAEVEVMRFDWHGRTHHLFHNGGAPNHGLRVRLVVDDPVSGQSTTTDARPSNAASHEPD